MSRTRKARGSRVGLGWLTTLGGAAVLLVCGFGVGLVGGSAFEDPELLARHLSGDATEVPLPEQVPGAARSPSAGPPAASPGAGAAAPAPQPGRSDFDTGDGQPDPGPTPEAVGGAARPAPAEPARPAPAEPARRAPPAAVASRPSGFAIQVGAFAERRAADDLVSSLRRDRLPAYVAEGARGEAAPFRVRVGPYPTRAEANDEAARLHARRRLPTWVIAEGGP